MLERKLLGAVTGNQHVFAFFENDSSKADRITNAFHGNNRAGLESSAVHENCVELHLAVTIEVRPDPGIEDRIIFEFDDRLFAGIERGTTVLENPPASIQRAPHSVVAEFFDFWRDVPSPAMDDQRDIVHKKSIAANYANDAN